MFRLTAAQEFRSVSFVAADAAGNLAQVENVRLVSSDETIVTVTDNSDGTFLVSTTGKLGTIQLNAEADARIGEGEKLIFGTETIEVVAGEAVVISIVPGEATERG